jgi:hypothetical protein
MYSTIERRASIELQHINVKLLLTPDNFELELVIPVFHRWIQDQTGDELLIDVADYRHVRSGPGVVLIGHEADYSLDQSDQRLGLRYNRKAVVPGSNQDRLEQAAGAALRALDRLQTEPTLTGGIAFDGRQLELFINDRLLAPNTAETRAAAESDFHIFFEKLYRTRDYNLEYNADPRSRFGVRARTKQPRDVRTLRENLAG